MNAPDGPGEDAVSVRTGFLLALGAFLIWGVMPLYFAALRGVPAWEVLAHRIVWALPFAVAIQWWRGRLGQMVRLLKQPRTLAWMAVPAVLIAVNWGVYIHAVEINRASEAALGYYITPILNVLTGAVALRERLDPLQWAAVTLVAIAILWRIVVAGSFPWIGLSLATSFAVYGYLRKTLPVGPVEGFLVEVLLLAPFALAAIAFWQTAGVGALGDDGATTLLLVGAGVVTAVPLILFTFGAKALRLSTIGLMGYIGPSLIFLFSFTLLGETLTATNAITFAIIWTALALYSWSAFARPATSASTSS